MGNLRGEGGLCAHLGQHRAGPLGAINQHFTSQFRPAWQFRRPKAHIEARGGGGLKDRRRENPKETKKSAVYDGGVLVLGEHVLSSGVRTCTYIMPGPGFLNLMIILMIILLVEYEH